MRTGNWLKKTAALLTVTALAFSLIGCGGKKEAKKFSVPKENLPEGVVSVIKPKPNNETMFVRMLVQESIRLNIVAQRYNEALIHYDPKKGNAKDHEKLLKKTKKAWQEARDASSVAMFYAMGLSQLAREEGYDPYQKTAMLTVPEIHLMPTAYAKEKGKLNTKEEVYSKIHGSYKVGIKKEIDRFPEEKQLLAISTMYHTNGKTACEIMKDVNPDYFSKGKSWEEITCDVAYRGANIAKTAGKVAGIGLAAVGTAAAAAPIAVFAGGVAVTVKIVDTGLDAVQTSMVVITGEENEELNKVLAVTGTADTVASIMTFDLTKPIANMKGVKSYTFTKDATLLDKVKGYGYMTKEGVKTVVGELAKKDLKRAAGQVNFEGFNNVVSVTTGVIGLKDNYDTLAGTSKETEDGRIETRTATLSLKNGTENDKLKAEALGLLDASTTMDDLKKEAQAAEQKKADSATASSTDCVKSAEEAANAGGATDYKETYQTFVDGVRKGLIENIIGPGGNISDLDKMLSEAAGEEMKATELIVSTDEQGNVKDIKVVAKKTDNTPPFAPKKVAGTYKVPHQGATLTFVVKEQGGSLIIDYQFYRNKELKHRREKPASYDPQTGKGTFAVENSSCPFWFTNENGKMSMGVGSWKKNKK